MPGPQPILALGEKALDRGPLHRPHRLGKAGVSACARGIFGEVLFLKEGWNAGRDTIRGRLLCRRLSLASRRFLHMWMNHPLERRVASLLRRGSTLGADLPAERPLFFLHLWGAPGPWEHGPRGAESRNTDHQPIGSRAAGFLPHPLSDVSRVTLIERGGRKAIRLSDPR